MNLGNVFILGDSYSTFENYIPEGYSVYYTSVPITDTDVERVEQTWWYQLMEETESNLLMNNSYSGTTICHTGYDGEDCSDKSFIARMDKLISEGYFVDNTVDTFLLFGGTNDSWANSPIGDLKYHDWSNDDLYATLPAFCYLLHNLRTKVTDTRVICIINTDLKTDIKEGFLSACDKFGVEIIILRDINKISGHPTILGMKQIREQVLVYLKKRLGENKVV